MPNPTTPISKSIRNSPSLNKLTSTSAKTPDTALHSDREQIASDLLGKNDTLQFLNNIISKYSVIDNHSPRTMSSKPDLNNKHSVATPPPTNLCPTTSTIPIQQSIYKISPLPTKATSHTSKPINSSQDHRHDTDITLSPDHTQSPPNYNQICSQNHSSIGSNGVDVSTDHERMTTSTTSALPTFTMTNPTDDHVHMTISASSNKIVPNHQPSSPDTNGYIKSPSSMSQTKTKSRNKSTNSYHGHRHATDITLSREQEQSHPHDNRVFTQNHLSKENSDEVVTTDHEHMTMSTTPSRPTITMINPTDDHVHMTIGASPNGIIPTHHPPSPQTNRERESPSSMSQMTRKNSNMFLESLSSNPNNEDIPRSAHNSVYFFWPNDALKIIQQIATIQSREIQPSNFIFDISTSASQYNWNHLQKFQNLGDAITHDGPSFVSYGAEFRKPDVLLPLLKFHPLWNKLRSIISNGLSFPLIDLDNRSRHLNLSSALKFGNHKGVSKNPEFYKTLNEDDVENGFSIPIPLTHLTDIPGALACPMNVIEQFTISEHGEIVEKRRACHDLSYRFPPSDTSVNSRVIKDKLEECRFGHCLTRIIHHIVYLRSCHPTTPILIQKIDWKSAYRRIHMNWETSIQCCSTYNDFALIPLRAVFGGSPCPSEWSIISETTTDIANFLLSNTNWDATTTHSPHQHLIPPEIILDASNEFKPALPMLLQFPETNKAKADVYIDDLIVIALASSPTAILNSSSAVPLAIHIIGRPLLQEEPIKRHNLMCLKKLKAEGQLEETKTVLGWTLNTRSLDISLPSHKFKVWMQSLDKLIQTRVTNHKEMETLIGRLTHLSVVQPNILHFMGNLRRLCYSSQNRRKVKVKQYHIDDVTLMQQFLSAAHEGIDLNLITCRKPTHCYFADACPRGLGGYNHQGVGWRWEILPHLRNRASINMLEHLASTIGPWLDMINNQIPPLSCILSMTDSTTSAGWLRKSNFADVGDTDPHMRAKMHTSRAHAARLIKYKIREYSQWFHGKFNILADALSRDFHLTDSNLVNALRNHLGPQMPQDFRIVPLPPTIVSWICTWLQSIPVNSQQLEEHRTSNVGLGPDGDNFYVPSICPKIYSSNRSNNTTESSSCLHSVTHSDKANIQSEEFLNWVRNQSEIPSIMWQRPSGAILKKTRGLTPTANLRKFYTTNLKATKSKIRQQNNKRRFPVVSSCNSTETVQQKERAQ